jgi:hypothetical protein
VSVSESKTASTELPWKVRFTWAGLEGVQHPKYTYDQRADEDTAIDCAVFMKDRNSHRAVLYVACAHIQAPGSDTWRRVD